MPVIGRALMSRPAMPMLDEPSLGLAAVIVERIGDILRDNQAREGLAVLLPSRTPPGRSRSRAAASSSTAAG
jgi:ABC-type branched-subunit amino acid transport system ATPase component